MTEYWYSDPKTGVKTVFVADNEEDAKKQWEEFLRLSKARRIEDFTASHH